MHHLFIALLLIEVNLYTQDNVMTIEFVGMKDGCPNTPTMWVSLHEALQKLQWNVQIDSLDVFVLSEQNDIRAGYGSPTILVNGKDLFGAPLPTTHDPACRYYRGGIPTAHDIMTKLKELHPSSGVLHE